MPLGVDLTVLTQLPGPMVQSCPYNESLVVTPRTPVIACQVKLTPGKFGCELTDSTRPLQICFMRLDASDVNTDPTSAGQVWLSEHLLNYGHN